MKKISTLMLLFILFPSLAHAENLFETSQQIINLNAGPVESAWRVSSFGGGFFDREMIIRRVVLTDDGKLEIYRTRTTGGFYLEGGQPPHEAWRDIYVAKDGKIILEKTIMGQYSPQSSRQEVIPESYNWQEK